MVCRLPIALWAGNLQTLDRYVPPLERRSWLRWYLYHLLAKVPLQCAVNFRRHRKTRCRPALPKIPRVEDSTSNTKTAKLRLVLDLKLERFDRVEF